MRGEKHGICSQGYQGQRLRFSSYRICSDVVKHMLSSGSSSPLLRWPHPLAHHGVIDNSLCPSLQPQFSQRRSRGMSWGMLPDMTAPKLSSPPSRYYLKLPLKTEEVKSKLSRGAQASCRMHLWRLMGVAGLRTVSDVCLLNMRLNLFVLEFSIYNYI